MPKPNDLHQFLQEFLQLLERVLQDKENLLPADLHRAFDEAWPEVRSRIRSTQSDLRTIGRLKEDLPDAGLAGRQLHLKLEGFGRALEALKGGWSRKLLKRVLKWADVILGSLASVLPGSEFVKEYKEALEAALEKKE